jgi:hypothetical protein
LHYDDEYIPFQEVETLGEGSVKERTQNYYIPWQKLGRSGILGLRGSSVKFSNVFRPSQPIKMVSLIIDCGEISLFVIVIVIVNNPRKTVSCV